MARVSLTEIESSLVASLLLSTVAALMILAQAQAAGEVSSNSFHRQDECGGHVLLDPGQAYHVTTGLGRLGCAKLCAQEERCLSYTTSGRDCLLYPVRLQTCGPSVTHPHASYYVKKWCYNGGILTTNTCSCPNYTRGNRCQHIMRDCKDCSEWSSTDGLYWVWPPAAPYPFPINCDMEWGPRAVVHRNYRGGAESFNRTWKEYKTGFGDINSYSFWIGLQKIYWLTAGREKTFILQCDTEDTKGIDGFPYKAYSKFRIGDESKDFELLQYAGGTEGPLTDCLTGVIGSKFVTYDHGDSAALRTCAGKLGAGWWLKPNGTECSFTCNPNGRQKQRQDAYTIRDVYFPSISSSLDIDAVYTYVQ